MNKRILIVDDEVAISWALKQTLVEDGYIVVVKNRGEQGLNECQKVHFDLVITDLRMPDMEGTELIKKIKQLNQDTKFIIMTAYPSLETALEGIRLKVENYISKPFQVEEIKDFIKTIFAKEKKDTADNLQFENLEKETLKKIEVIDNDIVSVVYLNKEEPEKIEKRIVILAGKESVIYLVKEMMEKDLKAYLSPDQLKEIIYRAL